MIDISALEPWAKLWSVMALLAPLITFSVLSSAAIYLLFYFFIRSKDSIADKGGQVAATAPAADVYEFGTIGQCSYLVLTAFFGIALGMLIKLVGGFSALQKDSPNTLAGAIITVLVIVLGVVGSLFAENGRIDARRPLGAISFLLSFLVSGFYWKLLAG
jgi:hypothetical protein